MDNAGSTRDMSSAGTWAGLVVHDWPCPRRL